MTDHASDHRLKCTGSNEPGQKGIKMSEPTKRCGNCRWWKAFGKSVVGICLAPVSDAIGILTKDMTEQTDGTDCPCFSPPIPEEVIEAARIHKESSLPCDSEAHIVASWAIENLPQLKGNQ